VHAAPMLLLLDAPGALAAAPGVLPEAPPATWHNVSLGISGEMTYRRLEVDGRRVDDSLTSFTLFDLLGLKLDYYARPVTVASLGVHLGWSQWHSEARIRGQYFDFGLEPRAWPLRFHHTDWYLGVPFGLSAPVVSALPQRAYETRIRVSSSWHIGGTLGADIAVRGPWRLYAEAGYLLHTTRLTATLSPLVREFPGAVEDWRYVDGTVFLRAGGTFGFGWP